MIGIERKLDEQIERDFKRLDDLEIGSQERSSAVEDVSKLYKLRIENHRTRNGIAEAVLTIGGNIGVLILINNFEKYGTYLSTFFKKFNPTNIRVRL